MVVGLGLFGFRKPLSRFLQDLARRLSAFHVEIELATVTSSSLSLPDLTLLPGENLTGSAFTPTTIMALLERARDDAPPHYLLVDIGDGRRWLISRLLCRFILKRIGAIGCVVFVETKWCSESSRS